MTVEAKPGNPTPTPNALVLLLLTLPILALGVIAARAAWRIRRAPHPTQPTVKEAT